MLICSDQWLEGKMGQVNLVLLILAGTKRPRGRDDLIPLAIRF